MWQLVSGNTLGSVAAAVLQEVVKQPRAAVTDAEEREATDHGGGAPMQKRRVRWRPIDHRPATPTPSHSASRLPLPPTTHITATHHALKRATRCHTKRWMETANCLLRRMQHRVNEALLLTPPPLHTRTHAHTKSLFLSLSHTHTRHYWHAGTQHTVESKVPSK